MVKMKWTGHTVERAGLLVQAGDVIEAFDNEAKSLKESGLAEPVSTRNTRGQKAEGVDNG